MKKPTQLSPFGGTFDSTPSEIYERHFVPAIGLPVARDLIDQVDLQPGDKVLDIACGTGVVTRLAAEKVLPGGAIAGVDVNAEMLEVARSATPENVPIQWYESPAESMPLPDEMFDVALCQLSLQFFADRPAALKEMHRVLVPGGRLAINVPGPITEVFEILADGLSRHVDTSLDGFVRQVFSLPEPEQLKTLVKEAGFKDVESSATLKTMRLPPPEQFLWQYVHSTPLTEPVTLAGDERRAALEREVVPRWQQFVDNGGMIYDQEIVVATARK